MTIDPKDEIAGQPILKIRDFLLRWTDRIDEELIGDVLEISENEAKLVLRELINRGYVERRPDDHGHSRTLAGGQLANAHATKRITRQTANRLLAEIVARIDEVNRREDFIYKVPRVAVFGSFLGDGPTLGDVDVAFDLERKHEDFDEHERAHEQRLSQAGRTFRDTFDEAYFSYNEVLRFIKNRNGMISIHDWDQLERTKSPFVEIYPKCDDAKVLAALEEGAKVKKPTRKHRPSPVRFTLRVTMEITVNDPKSLFAELTQQQAKRHDGDVPEDVAYYDLAEALTDLSFDRLEEGLSTIEGVETHGGSSWARRIPKSELERRKRESLDNASDAGKDGTDDPGE